MALWFLAQQDPLLVYLNYGVLGVTVVLLLLAKIVPGVIHDRTEQRHEKEITDLRDEHREAIRAKDEFIAKRDEEILRLNAYIAQEVIPAIIKFTEAQTRERERSGRNDYDNR